MPYNGLAELWYSHRDCFRRRLPSSYNRSARAPMIMGYSHSVPNLPKPGIDSQPSRAASGGESAWAKGAIRAADGLSIGGLSGFAGVSEIRWAVSVRPATDSQREKGPQNIYLATQSALLEDPRTSPAPVSAEPS